MIAASASSTIPPIEPAPTTKATTIAAGATRNVRRARSLLVMFLDISASLRWGGLTCYTTLQLIRLFPKQYLDDPSAPPPRCPGRADRPPLPCVRRADADPAARPPP